MKIHALSLSVFTVVLLALSGCNRADPQVAMSPPVPENPAFGAAFPSSGAADPGWQAQHGAPQGGHAAMASATDSQHLAAYQAGPATGPYDSAPPMPPNGGGGAPQQPFRGGQPAGGGEGTDFGVAPTQQLRPTQQLHGPTPTSIPGGKLIDTQSLAQLLQTGIPVVVMDIYGGPQHLPGAVPAAPAGQGGSFDDQVQQGFAQYLQQATGGDKSRFLVFYCGGVQCWSSYNAALRAIALDYRAVHWYRGGIEAWQQAGLPLASANNAMQGQPAAQRPDAGRMQAPANPPPQSSTGPQW